MTLQIVLGVLWVFCAVGWSFCLHAEHKRQARERRRRRGSFIVLPPAASNGTNHAMGGAARIYSGCNGSGATVVQFPSTPPPRGPSPPPSNGPTSGPSGNIRTVGPLGAEMTDAVSGPEAHPPEGAA